MHQKAPVRDIVTLREDYSMDAQRNGEWTCSVNACMESGWVVVVDRLCTDMVGLGIVKLSPADVVGDTGEHEKKEKKMDQEREEDGRQLRMENTSTGSTDVGKGSMYM